MDLFLGSAWRLQQPSRNKVTPMMEPGLQGIGPGPFSFERDCEVPCLVGYPPKNGSWTFYLVSCFQETKSICVAQIKREGQTAGFGPCFHVPGQPILVPVFLSHSHLAGRVYTSRRTPCFRTSASRAHVAMPCVFPDVMTNFPGLDRGVPVSPEKPQRRKLQSVFFSGNAVNQRVSNSKIMPP